MFYYKLPNWQDKYTYIQFCSSLKKINAWRRCFSSAPCTSLPLCSILFQLCAIIDKGTPKSAQLLLSLSAEFHFFVATGNLITILIHSSTVSAVIFVTSNASLLQLMLKIMLMLFICLFVVRLQTSLPSTLCGEKLREYKLEGRSLIFYWLWVYGYVRVCAMCAGPPVVGCSV